NITTFPRKNLSKTRPPERIRIKLLQPLWNGCGVQTGVNPDFDHWRSISGQSLRLACRNRPPLNADTGSLPTVKTYALCLPLTSHWCAINNNIPLIGYSYVSD